MAIAIGDVLLPVPVGAGVRCPRGPFCIPLRTSSKPIFISLSITTFYKCDRLVGDLEIDRGPARR